MGWLKSAAEIVKGFLAAIPILDRWFTKTPTQKIEDDKERIRKESDEERKTGRPSH